MNPHGRERLYPYRCRTVRQRRRSGLTLIEVMVIVSILMLLASLLMPAVQSAREAARRAQCANNLRNLIIATHGFETTNGILPRWAYGKRLPDRSVNYCSIHAQLLPFMEMTSLHSTINYDIPCVIEDDLVLGNYTAATVTVGTFLCPSDPYSVQDHYGANNYRANVGTGGAEIIATSGPSKAIRFIENGAFSISKNTRLSDFHDGLSHTIGFSEKPVGTGTSGKYSAFRDWIVARDALDPQEQISICSSITEAPHYRLNAGRPWLLGGAVYTSFFSSVPPNSPIPDCGNLTGNGKGLFAARSYHPDGVNAVMLDGSARWFKSSIDVSMWRSMGTRNGAD